MKLWHLAPLVLLLSQGHAFGRDYGMAGCGLGSLAFKEDGMIQILAGTTNSTAYNQLFGISSGTSNCKTASQMAAVQKQENFVSENLENLHRDMVKGDGEFLHSYAEVLGCDAQSYSTFASYAKSQQATIFQAPGAVAVLEATKNSLRQNPQLQNACVNLI